MISRQLVLVLVFVVLAFFHVGVQSLHHFDAYRMYQLERGGIAFGSQKTSLNLEATTSLTYDLSRKILLLPLEHCSPNTTALLLKAQPDAVLLLLPLGENNATSSSSWLEFEQHLLSTKFPFPFYFTFREENLVHIYSEILASQSSILKSSTSSDVFKFSVPGPEPSPIDNLELSNFQAVLNGVALQGRESESLPSLAVVAHYDTFAAAPGLAKGADSNGSGSIALLELARLFSKLYRGYKTQPPYDLIFLLVSGGKLNYAGSNDWLKNVDSRLLSNIEFVLCLEAIATSTAEEPLYLHVTKSPKEPKLIQLFQDFNSTAEHMGINLELVRRKVNLTAVDVTWEHHLYVKKRLPAATLSRFNTTEFGSFQSRSSIFDTREKINFKLLARNIKFIAETIGKFIFDIHEPGLELFNGSQSILPEFLESQLATLTSYPRASLLLPQDSPIITHLENVLKQYSSNVVRQNFKLDTEYRFYGGNKSLISCFKVKSIWFEIGLSIFVLIYLALIRVALKGQDAFDGLKEYVLGLFTKSSKPKRKGQ